jgi:antitoxin ParD1/3/4
MVVRKSICISITPELDRFVAAQVASGRYQTTSEVFRAGLRLLERDEGGASPWPRQTRRRARSAKPERA